jgi:hypothetical protein
MKYLLSFLLLWSCWNSSFAEPADSTMSTKPRKHPWLAAGEIVVFNGGLVVYNAIRNSAEDFSHITMKDIRRNVTHGYWWWDCDGFRVNTIEHPIHGVIYYNIARLNGMSVVESSLYTLGGSWMWEIFCESEQPSINDMVYTTFGGITLGEPIYRTGRRVFNDLFRRGKVPRDTTPFTLSLSAGYRAFWPNHHPTVRTGYLTLESSYGDMMDDESGLFDYFQIRGTAVFGSNQFIVGAAKVTAQLYSQQLVDEPQRKVVWGIYNHFDYDAVAPYYDLPKSEREKHYYGFSEVGVFGPGIAYRLGDKNRVEQQLHVTGIAMGTTPTTTQHKKDGQRGYSFGSGYGAKLITKAKLGDVLSASVDAEFSQLFTWDGFYDDDPSRYRPSIPSIQGEAGNAVTLIVTPSVTVTPIPALSHLSLEGRGRFFHSHFNYKYHPHSSTHAWEVMAGVKYTF